MNPNCMKNTTVNQIVHEHLTLDLTQEEFDVAVEAVMAYRVEKEREAKKNELIKEGNEILRQLRNLGYTPNVPQLVVCRKD